MVANEITVGAPQEPAPTGGSFLSGITSLFGNLGGHTPGNGAAYAQNSGGTGGFLADVQVPLDHVKFTMNPASAEQKIPAAQNSQMREGHRMAHEAIYKGLGGSNDAGELKN